MTGYSEHIIWVFIEYFIQLIAVSPNDDDITIGGNGVIVEIDETKLNKCKYHRGHRVDGVWVVVWVERSFSRRVFVDSVSDRSASTLTTLIQRHVLPGSTIYIDCRQGYTGLNHPGSIHQTVNHSKGFKNALTGVDTNTVEGSNNR